MMYKHKLLYMSKTTGECWESREKAMEAYRAGDEIAVLDWSEALEEWVNRCDWVH